MKDIRTGRDLKEFPILEDPKLYVYIILNDIGKVKIGKTKNIQQRYMSLCGSNGQGNEIKKICVSPSTYLYTIESIMHGKFEKYRIVNTEWFFDKTDMSGERLFNDAVQELKLLFSSTGYKLSNNLRKEIHEKKKGGESNDNSRN